MNFFQVRLNNATFHTYNLNLHVSDVLPSGNRDLTQNPDSIIFEKKTTTTKNHIPKIVDYNYLVKEVSHLLNDS